MIVKVISIIGVLAILIGGAYYFHLTGSLATAQTLAEDSLTDTGIDRYMDNLAFGVGERFDFDINYGFINAGYAAMEVVDIIEYNDRPCYLVSSTANSNRFFSSFYRVEDKVETVIDAVGLFPWRFEKHLSEGSYRADRICDFDQVNNAVVYQDSTIEVQPYVQDALSVLYYIRTLDLKPNSTHSVENFTDGESYSLEVKVLRRETIKVKAGRFDCIVVEPLLKSSGIFKHEGRLTVWLTDDRLKMPVLMKSKVLVGSISAELTDYQLGEIVEF